MGANGNIRSRKSTCLYLDAGVVETARRVGLNISKVSENALIEAIGRLTGPERGTVLNSPPRREGRGRDLNPGARLQGQRAVAHARPARSPGAFGADWGPFRINNITASWHIFGL